MATVYITEYGGVGMTVSGPAQVASEPRLVSQTVAIGAEAKSAAFSVNTHFIRLHADAVCSFTIGPTPTATAAMSRMAAGQTEYFMVSPGHKVSVITNT